MRVEIKRESDRRVPDIYSVTSLLHGVTDLSELVVNQSTLVAVNPPDSRYFYGFWYQFRIDTDFTLVFRKKGMVATAWWVYLFNGVSWEVGSWSDIPDSDQVKMVKRVRGRYKRLTGVPWDEGFEGLVVLGDL